MPYSCYYQAHICKSDTWFLTATLRSFEHLAFDRALQKEDGLFEFFVPENLESFFLEIIAYYQQQGIVTGLKKISNRLAHADAEV